MGCVIPWEQGLRWYVAHNVEYQLVPCGLIRDIFQHRIIPCGRYGNRAVGSWQYWVAICASVLRLCRYPVVCRESWWLCVFYPSCLKKWKKPVDNHTTGWVIHAIYSKFKSLTRSKIWSGLLPSSYNWMRKRKSLAESAWRMASSYSIVPAV